MPAEETKEVVGKKTTPQKKKNPVPKKHSRFTLAHISAVEKIFFVQNLAVLVKAGFSLSNGLITVAKQTTNKRLKEVVDHLALDVQSGVSFATALRRYEKVFDPLFINMIEAGELSGKLELTLNELAIQMKKSHSLFLKVRNALAYPTIILIAMLFIGTGMMIFVIPKIVALYADASYQLPLITRIVITLSDFIIGHGILTAGVLIAFITLIILLYKQAAIQLAVHRLLLRMPVVGTLIREFNVARFSRVFHSLISTDIPIIETFTIITKTLGNRAYQEFLRTIIPQLERGVSIGAAIGQNPQLFPATVVEMIIVAEASGSLEEMTKEIAEHFEEEVSTAMDGLSVLIEPLLMLSLGVAVGLIAVAVLWPMYNLVNVI
ncbi:MAG: type II secretion system F family protein [Candidatus Kerfeldbacteria bacterium]|nr:type II secretion system F family protein [Candidatus Kerfeldbacteria bacterium]